MKRPFQIVKLFWMELIVIEEKAIWYETEYFEIKKAA